MSVGFLNLVRVTLSTTGTGSTLTINAAVAGWLDFAGAGGVNGTVYRYAIIDGNNSEIGTITYNSGTNTLSGRTVTNSTNGGLAINLTSAAILAVSVAGQDLVPGGTNFGTIASQAASAVAITGGTIAGVAITGSTIPWVDVTGVPGSFSGFANPSASLVLTAVNGSATTAMRSDAAPALSQSISPTWTGNHTFNNTVVGASSVSFTASGGSNAVALLMPSNNAIRDNTNGASTMFFDVSLGGATDGAFQFRSSNSLRQLMNIGIGTGGIAFPQYVVGSLGISNSGSAVISDGAYVTPQMYGATGNGTTDDTTALSNALNSGKPIWLVGKFKITSAITVNISVAGTSALAVYGGGQWASQILFADNAAKITVNVPYSGDLNSSNPSFVLKDFVNVATGAVTIGTAATVNGTSGVISSGAFAGMWSIIGSPTSGNALIGSQAKLGDMSNVGFTTDGTGVISCGLLLQDLRVATFTGLYFPQFSATSWPLVVRPTIQALGNAPNLLVFDKCTGVGGLYGFAVLASGAPIFSQTGTFTTSSANISGTTWVTVGLQITIPAGTASVPLPFVAGTAYYIVSASGGNIQLSATSGGSPITVTGATHTVALTAQLQDYEGVTFRDCSMIGCASYGLFACGSDGTNNVIVVADSTWATSAANSGGASGGVYIFGWTGVTVTNNNFESGMTSGTFRPFLIQNNNNVFPFFGVMTGNTAIVPTTLTRSYFFNITGTDSSYHPAGANQIN